MTEPVRLAKRLAEIVPCSRREAELYIVGGWVTVDGQVIEEPQFKVMQQRIELHPEASLAPVEAVTLLLHQPAGISISAAQELLAADTHSADDASGVSMLKQHFARLTPTLPLEENASGLLVFTQDWRVARKLLDDAATVEQEYIVEVIGEMGPDGLKRLNQKNTLNGKALPQAKVSWQNETRLRFALKGAQPGQIAHLCRSVGVAVQTMKRIRIGRVSMAKLQPGQWRYLGSDERF